MERVSRKIKNKTKKIGQTGYGDRQTKILENEIWAGRMA